MAMAPPALMTPATLLPLGLLVLTLLLLAPSSRAAVSCNATDADVCEARLWPGSTCRDGQCSNPFRSGCLRALFSSDRYSQSSAEGGASPELEGLLHRLQEIPRACNSEDTEKDVEAKVCTRHANDYPEVRVWAQNWESGYILAWIMQIIYSELLNVPATIETGVQGNGLNFYDAANRMEVGKANEYKMFQNAHSALWGDCGVYREENARAAAGDYKPCAHLVMDVWSSNEELVAAQEAGVAEAMHYTGMVAFNGWHITRFSVKRDPSLASHFGLAGEENREKLAETFKRPTTWRAYCATESATNCTVADEFATRAPSEEEEGKYFSAGAYTGFFRATEKNDCCEGKCNCTGHFMDYPCGWTSYVKQQTKYLGIALESDGNEASGGYSYAEMVEVWKAADATKSDVIGKWWIPDATAKLLMGSGSDLLPVMLPPVTQVCMDNRVDIQKRCDASATEFDIYGDEKGACGEPNMFTQKGAVGNMQDNILNNLSPKARMSPGYDAYKNFEITDLQVDQILSEWVDRDQDRDNFDLRFATCQWVADNLDDVVERFVPQSHPRSFDDTSKHYYQNALTIVALVFSVIAIISVMGTAGCVLYKNKQGNLGRGAQFDFMVLILAGLFLVSIGSLLWALEPSKGSCVGAMWMISVGYTAQLVPILMCVSTILKLVRASTKMRIIKINRKQLVTRSIAFIGIAVAFTTVWTVVDPPDSEANVYLTDETNDFGETIVSISNYCRSKYIVWPLLGFVFHALLLVCATALAFQMRSVPSAINNSRELATMIYSSAIFLFLRVIAYCLSEFLSDDSLGKDFLQKVTSLLLSIDTMANTVIYFARYFKPKEEVEAPSSSVWEGRSQTNVSFSLPEHGRQVEAPQVLPKLNESHSFSSGDRSEISVQEEKEEEASTTVRFRMKNKSVTLPKWLVEKYGETEVHTEQDPATASTVRLTEDTRLEEQKED